MQTKNFENLKNTLQDSIFTWDYFTDFEKVKTNVKKIEKELNLLNFKGMSCESIALHLLKQFELNKCVVSEDNENAAIITR